MINSYFPSLFLLASKGEDLMLSLYKAMDVNEGIYYDKDTRVVVDIDLIQRFTSPEFGRKCMEMVIRLQSYELTVTDQVLLKAVCFLCPGSYFLFFNLHFI